LLREVAALPAAVKSLIINFMKKTTLLGLMFITVILVVVAYLYVAKPFVFQVSWTPQAYKIENVHPLYAHWADWLKFATAFVAAFFLICAVKLRKTIGMLRTPLIFLAAGVLMSAISYFSGCFTRSVLNFEAGVQSFETYLGMFAIPFIIVAFILLNAKIKVKLNKAREIIFWVVTGILAALMIVLAIIPTITNPDDVVLMRIVKATIDFGVLVAFIGAFRAMLVFSGGKLGHDWLLVSLGAILLNIYFFYVMSPGIPNIDVFHWINLFWVGGYLTTALGAIQLTFPELS
jgi:hypothetical protein